MKILLNQFSRLTTSQIKFQLMMKKKYIQPATFKHAEKCRIAVKTAKSLTQFQISQKRQKPFTQMNPI
jgi:hypothetical protein